MSLNQKIKKTWYLPKPKKIEGKYIWHPIVMPKFHANWKEPWGYDVSEDDPDLLIPDSEALELLEQAKIYIKRYTKSEVAEWLSVKSGRPITAQGITRRIQLEQRHKKNASRYRQLEQIAKEAAKKAKYYEERTGGIRVRVPRDDTGDS